MRKIEQAMNGAIALGINWASGNTMVTDSSREGGQDVLLHGNHIATVFCDGSVMVNKETLKEYPTNTTKSRLRALGADVCTRKGITYLDGVAV
jgi:hypothetical protein